MIFGFKKEPVVDGAFVDCEMKDFGDPHDNNRDERRKPRSACQFMASRKVSRKIQRDDRKGPHRGQAYRMTHNGFAGKANDSILDERRSTEPREGKYYCRGRHEDDAIDPIEPFRRPRFHTQTSFLNPIPTIHSTIRGRKQTRWH
jgi:hypothetical protein